MFPCGHNATRSCWCSRTRRGRAKDVSGHRGAVAAGSRAPELVCSRIVSIGALGRLAHTRRVKPRLVRSLTAAVAFAAALFAAEALVRVVFPHARDHAIPAHLLSVDDALGWKLRPLLRSTHVTRYFRVEYVTDELGFRDARRTFSSGQPRTRLLLYGDSMVFGWGIPEGQRFSDRLEQAGRDLQVLNHGVPGYGLDQEVLAYEAEPSRADEAMFFVGESTLRRIHSPFIYAKYKPMFVADPDGRLKLVPVPQTKNRTVFLAYGALSPFYLPYLVQDEVTWLTMPSTSSDPALVDGLTEAILRRALDVATRRRERMSVLVANLSQTDRLELRRVCREAAIQCFEIPPALSVDDESDDANDLIFGHFDKHWNEKANELIARELLRYLTSQTTGDR